MSLSDLKSLEIVEHDAHVTEVRLIGPGQGNPLGRSFWSELPLVLAALSGDESVRAVVIRTEDEHFSYGLDLVDMGPGLGPALEGGFAGRQQIATMGAAMQDAFHAIADCPKPVIAAVNGWCIGGGIEFIAACDIRMCSADAMFSLREVKMSIVPDLGGIQRLPYLIGEGRLREMALTGDDYPATWALEAGLVTAIHDSPEALARAAFDMAGRLAANPPATLAGIKQVLGNRVDAEVRRGLREALTLNTSLLQSDDFKEAVTAFMERRKPSFKGR